MASMMGDRGQMMLMSAILMSAILMTICGSIIYMNSQGMANENGLTSGMAGNILSAQNSGFNNAAEKSSAIYSYDNKLMAVSMFKGKAGHFKESLACSLLKHGMIYYSAFNETLAAEYVNSNSIEGDENIQGVIIKNDAGNVAIYGYAYDTTIKDYKTEYKISEVIVLE
jgi:hypothetical protein